MYALATWAGHFGDHTAEFDRIATLAASAVATILVGEALILLWLGTRKDYGPHIPLAAMISAATAFIAASVLPVAGSVAIATAIAATFLLNGRFRTFVLFCVGALVISVAVALAGSHGLNTILGGVLVGVSSALFANLAFAGLILATVLRSCDIRDREQAISRGSEDRDV
jgi:hypothetical protein